MSNVIKCPFQCKKNTAEPVELLMQLSEHLPPHVEKQSALVALDPVGTSIVENRRNCRQLSAVNLIFPRMPEPGATTKRKN